MKNSFDDLGKALEILKKGGIVVFPTDTAFAVSCRFDKKKSVRKLFRLRNRPMDQPTPILVDTLAMAQKYLHKIPQAVISELIEPFWPGALTIVLRCKVNRVLYLARGGGKTLGIRIPNHQIPRYLIRNLGLPLLGPSANFHGAPTPHSFENLDPNFVKVVDFVIPGECLYQKPSTVIDCSQTPWKIIRQGQIQIPKKLNQ